MMTLCRYYCYSDIIPLNEACRNGSYSITWYCFNISLEWNILLDFLDKSNWMFIYISSNHIQRCPLHRRQRPHPRHPTGSRRFPRQQSCQRRYPWIRGLSMASEGCSWSDHQSHAVRLPAKSYHQRCRQCCHDARSRIYWCCLWLWFNSQGGR